MTQSKDYAPVVFPKPPPAVIKATDSNSKRRSSNDEEKIGSKTNPHDASWDDKCNTFLQKLTKPGINKIVTNEKSKNKLKLKRFTNIQKLFWILFIKIFR